MNYDHQEVDINSLSPNPWNTNVVSPDNEAKLDESLRRFGLFKPILVRDNGKNLEILGGQHRWEAARRAGHAKVPVVNFGKISDAMAKEIGLVDNGRYGVDDADGLASLLRELSKTSELSSFLPYSDKELEVIFKTEELDFDSLDIDGDDEDIELRPTDVSTAPTHQIMRFKVQVEDAEWVSKLIQSVIKQQGMTDSDALTNAGDALVHVLRDWSKE
jgi:ParB family transcriptional regulator, chromosome partitioning protein